MVEYRKKTKPLGAQSHHSSWVAGRARISLPRSLILAPLAAGLPTCHRSALAVFLLLAFFGSSRGYAEVKSDFRKQLEEHWFRQLTAGQGQNSAILPEQDAFGAVNGDRYESVTGFHTLGEGLQWWQVDLGTAVPVGRIVVCNRPGFEGRARNLEVLLSGDGVSWKKMHACNGQPFYGGRTDSEPLTLRLAGEKARYVRMQLNGDFLNLNEVEVYAQRDDKTNVALKKHATQSSTSPWSTKWLDEVPAAWKADKGAQGPRVQKKDLEDALELATKTLAYVQKVKPLGTHETYLQAYKKSWADGAIAAKDYDDFYVRIRLLRRSMILSHPDCDFAKILLNRTPPTAYSHNGDQHLGIHSRPGPGLTVLSNWKAEPVATSLLAGKLPAGAVRNPDLHYDAGKVAFAFCDHTAPERKRYFLYEAAIDGSGVRQLTGTARDKFETWEERATVVIEDNDPCYMPDDTLVFVSTRSQSFGRCHGGRYNPAWVLHGCDSNGDAIRQLSFGNENEYEPSVLNDGRIIFTRWEYTDRHEMLFHMLWWCRPDGSAVSHYYGNDTLHPMMVVEASAIPGTHRVVSTAMGHHSYSTGTTVVLDINKGENGEEPVTHITPETPYSETKGWPNPHYSHPYAVNEDLFLVSRANHPVPHQGQVPPLNDRAIYLVDTLGGRELIYEDPSVACVSPIAVRKRKRPPVIPPMVPPNPPDYATVYVQNAYLTRNDPEGKIKPGMIKALRVNALGVQPRANRTACSQGCPNEIPKRVVGTVPVDENGSAFFKVPARTSLQMQMLDKNGMAILTEKSLFYLQPGENRSCVGCHAEVGASPGAAAMAKASHKKPMELIPPTGPSYPGGLSFMRTVQPVLDRYCIRCHGLGEGEDRKADAVNLIHDGTIAYPRSYLEIVKRGEHRLGEKSYMWGDFNISRPFMFYAFSNKVAHMLRGKHSDVNLDTVSYMRVIEWLDLNAQCYGDLFPNKLEERQLNGQALSELKAYAARALGDKFGRYPDRALVNAAQPDESLVLLSPLAKAAGGWGQVQPGWTSKEDPGFKKMQALVASCIVRKPNENTNGWTPTFEQGAGEQWVLDDRNNFRAKIAESRKLQVSHNK
jgi:hypothetical protein